MLIVCQTPGLNRWLLNPVKFIVLLNSDFCLCQMRTQTLGWSNNNKFVRLRGRPYIHTCRCGVTNWSIHRPLCAGQFVRFWAFGQQSSPKCESLHWTPMNCRAKFDAASFILGGEICNRTNTQNYKQKQTVNNISTPCLSAWRDNNDNMQILKVEDGIGNTIEKNSSIVDIMWYINMLKSW